MTYKLNKIFLVLGVIILSLMLSSCNREEIFVFQEGIYEYTGDPIDFYEDVKITYISLTFTEVENDTTGSNIMVNRKNNKAYNVKLYMENEIGEGFYFDFTTFPRVGDQNDRYFIDVDMAHFINVDSAILELVIEISNSEYYKHKVEERSNYIKADEIDLQLMRFTVNGTILKGVKSYYYIYPDIHLKYIDEE